MILLSKILKNDIRRNEQTIKLAFITSSEFDGFLYYLHMDKVDSRLRVEMITGTNIIPSNDMELLKTHSKSIHKYLNEVIIQFNKGNINIKQYPILKSMLNDIKTKFGKPLKLIDIEEPTILIEKYKIFK